jgi:dipeptidyl aminopeptidase/acylaminoacyl peptidase
MTEIAGKEDKSHLDPDDLVRGPSSVGGFSFSPDGKAITFSWTKDGSSQIHIASLSRFRPRLLTYGQEACSSPSWSPDGKLIAFFESGEGCRIRTVDPADGTCRTLIDLATGSCSDLTWSPDGNHLAFSSSMEGSSDIFTIRADGSGLNRLTSGPEQDSSSVWSPDSSRILFVSDLPGAERDREVRIIHRDGFGLRSVGLFRSASWSPDGKQMVVTSGEPFHTKAGSIDVDTEQVAWFSMDDQWMWNPVCSPDGKKLACVSSKGGNSRIALYDLDTGRFSIRGPKSGICGPPEFSPDGNAVVFSHRGPKEPDGLWLLNLCSGRSRQLLDCLPDSINRQLLSVPEETHYTSFDGLEIPAFLYKPARLDRGSPPPAVVWLHGGPNFQFFNMWHPMIQLLQSNGYLVMAPNFRGSIGYGPEFCDMKKGDWAGGDLKDVVAAADWLESTGLADGSRIALIGGSYGGYLMLMTLAKAPGRWAAGIDLFGFVNLETFYRNALDYVQLMVRSQIGTPEENSTFYRERSPINNCDTIAAPLLILHGSEDEVVPLSESKQMADRLHSLGKTCELKVLDGDHALHRTEGQIDYMKTILEFLDRYVGERHHEPNPLDRG